MGDQGKWSFTQKAKIVNQRSLCSTRESTCSKLQYDPSLISVMERQHRQKSTACTYRSRERVICGMVYHSRECVWCRFCSRLRERLEIRSRECFCNRSHERLEVPSRGLGLRHVTITRPHFTWSLNSTLYYTRSQFLKHEQ